MNRISYISKGTHLTLFYTRGLGIVVLHVMVPQPYRFPVAFYIGTSGFWPRVRARALRAPVFLGSLPRPTGRCAPPRPSQLRCSPKNNKNWLFPETKCFPSGPNSGSHGRIFFHWAKLHPTELHSILQSYSAPFWAPLRPPELRCTLLSFAAFHWATPHPIWAKPHLLS